MTSPVGLHRVLEPAGVLPQAAGRLDTRPEIGADEGRVAGEWLKLDAASFRQVSAEDRRGGGAGLATDRAPRLALAVYDVSGAPALTARVVRGYRRADDAAPGPTVAVLGGAGKSGSLALLAARRAGAARTVGVVPDVAERDRL